MSLPFIVLSALLVSSALAVVLLRNPIHSALALIVNLIGVACIFALLDAHFLAVVQVIVYAGAIMVLVVFVLMLLSVKVEDRGFAGWVQLVIASMAAASFVSLIAYGSYEQWGGGLSSLSQDGVPLEGTVQALGFHLYNNYLLPFEAASILIMAAIVGATMLAKAEKPKERA